MSALDAISLELHEEATKYARRSERLASEPYFREAVLKTSVASYVWALFDTFCDVRHALKEELEFQAAAVSRSANLAPCESIILQAVDHVQLAMPSGEEERARAFYTAVLGLREQPKPSELAARGGCWFEGAVKVHLGVEEPFRPALKAHVAFRVDDVAGLARAARAGGFEVVDDAELPGHERVFIFDPFGNRLEFLKAMAS